MEEAPVVDCPPTPEILPLSSTPPSRPDVVYSSSSEEGDEPTDGRRSPPPKCAICLGKCRQRAFTNSCKHQFCFRCLLEWSKVKPECPLCKQRFFSIVYYKSMDCFEQHTVAVPSANVPRVSTRNMYHELNVFLTNSQRFTAYAIPNMTLRLQSNNERLQELLLHQSSEVDRFIREYGNQPIPTRQDELRWRQFIYANRLYACPLPDLNGRFRETSASFYRNNPAQMHRVLSWMHRDLLVLSTNIAIHAPNIHVLEDLLQMHDIDSRDFLLRILRHMPLEDGEHFQHECVNFARSPYDIIGYDRCVQYNPRFIQRRVRSQVIISSSEEDNDDIVYLPEPAAGTSSTNEPPNASGGAAAGGEGVSNGSSSGGATGAASATSGSSSTAGRNEVNIEFPLLDDIVAGEEVHPVSASASLPRVPLTSIASTSLVPGENILLSSSDSDDCQFVLAQKPPHLRTPDHVVDLESASDSDVVFVAEEPLETKATVRTSRQQQQQANSLKKETAGTQEYNNGASTSSGYCGGGNGNGAGGGASSGSVASGSALRSKYYVRPRLTRYSGGMGVKSIYEATDSDDSDSDTLFNLPQGRRQTSNTANDSSSHDEVEFGARAQRKRRKPNKKATSQQPKVSKRASRKRRNSSVSSSSSHEEDCSGSNSSSSSSSSEDDSDSSSSNSSCSSSSNSSSSSSNSSSSSSSSSNGYGASNSYHKNITVEIECGRQLRRNTAQQSRASYTARLKSDQTDTKGRSKKKRSRKEIEKESKKVTGSKSKSHRTKSKKKAQSTSRTAKDTAKASRTKSKSKSRGSRGAAGRSSSKGKKRTKPSSDVGEDEPSRSTSQLADEDASTRAHYVIASRPSVSPTVDVTTVDGTDGGRERKLKSVIIKRCHYNKASTNRAAEAIDEVQEGTASGSVVASRTEPSTSTTIKGETVQDASAGTSFTDREPPAGHTDLLKCALSSASSSSSETESEQQPVAATPWEHSSSVIAPLAQIHRTEPYQAHNHQPQDWPPAETFDQQLQLPNTDQQQLEPDESTTNTGASESLFEPTLTWAEETVPDRALLPDDRALSSAAASPFSSISFPPSTTSVSPSPSMSSQSLALAAVPSPLQLIESLGGTMDSTDSPLPSSVLGIDAIDGTIDELMASEVASAAASIADPAPIGMDDGGLGEAGQATTAVPSEAVVPMATSDGVAAPVQLQL